MPPRILFVDDHEDARDMIVAVLGSGGYEVTTAGGSEDGLRLVWLRDGSTTELAFKLIEITEQVVGRLRSRSFPASSLERHGHRFRWKLIGR